MASDVERVLMKYRDILLVKVQAKENPITGQHCEVKSSLWKNRGLT